MGNFPRLSPVCGAGTLGWKVTVVGALKAWLGGTGLQGFSDRGWGWMVMVKKRVRSS